MLSLEITKNKTTISYDNVGPTRVIPELLEHGDISIKRPDQQETVQLYLGVKHKVSALKFDESHVCDSTSVFTTEISFHFTLPKEGELIGPVVGATPPLINQLKQTLRHSTPIGRFFWSRTTTINGKSHNTI